MFNGEGCLTQNSIQRGRLLDMGHLLEAGRLLDHLRYVHKKEKKYTNLVV